MNDKTIIGRIEKIDLPEFGIFGIEAKVDTGAFNSAIHCKDAHEEIAEGKSTLVFTLLDEGHPNFNGKAFTAHNFRARRIRSSNGQKEYRYQIKTRTIVAGREVEITLNLSNRAGMSKPILIGRSSLAGNFLVDVSKKA